MATASFLASRAVPSGGFYVALAGGVALARAAERQGGRAGFGASIAAMLQTVAIIGPARISVPLTQAISAPWLGRLHFRKASWAAMLAVAAAVRLVSNTLFTLVIIYVLLGGVDVYTGTFDATLGRLPFLPEGEDAALGFTVLSLVFWTMFASWIQVGVYRRGLDNWPAAGELEEDERHVEPTTDRLGTFDPRVIVLASALAFGGLLASFRWPVLVAGTAFLLVVWPLSRPQYDLVRAGAALAGFLGFSAFLASLIGGVGLASAAERGMRAVLLVAVATWLRAAAGAGGLREVWRRTLHRLERVPSLNEASHVLDGLGAGRELAPAGRSLLNALEDVPTRPIPFVDAVLGWVAAESARFRRGVAAGPLELRARARDALLFLAAGAPLAAAALWA